MKKITKKTLLIILAILMIVTTVHFTFAADGSEEGNVAISLDENGVMLISGTGALTYNDTVDIAGFVKENRDEIIHIVFGEGITEIPKLSQNYFMIMETVETLSLPSTVETIDPAFFCIATGVKEYIVAPENDDYLSEGGIIFNSDKTVLVAYPTAMKTEEYTVPDGIVTIGKRAFYLANIDKLITPSTLVTVKEDAFNMSSLKELELADGIVTIAENAFRMTLLKNVEIPETVEYIGDTAFAYISPLENVTLNKDIHILGSHVFDIVRNRITVHYPGTAEEWGNIKKGTDSLGYGATFHLGDSVTYKDAKEVTCGEDGNEAGYFCSECDAYVSGKHFAATGDHDFKNSVCTVCKCVCEHKNHTDGLCQDCETLLYIITHQPTSGQPYVELSDDTDASYQWYEGAIQPILVTDENATGDWKEFSYLANSTYNKETGWWTSASAHYFLIELKYGQVLNFEFNQNVNRIFAQYENESGTRGVSKYPGSTEYTFVAEGDGLYGFEIHGEDPNPENLAVRATVEDFVYTAIEGNGASIENTDGGKHYYCLVTFADGSTEKSDDFIGRYAISDHPDESELNVDINAGKATYQWYKVNLGEEITDENTFVTHSFSGLGYEYTPEKGWEEKEISNGNSDFFAVKVGAGEAITVFVDGVINGGTVLIDANYNKVVAEATPNAENMYILRPEKSGTYLFAIIATGDDAVTVRAFFGEAEFVEIEGATDNTYYPEEDGNYCCEVTFEDGTTERSSYVYYCPHNGETETFNVADKTCTVDGYTGDTKCIVCGKIIVYGEVISASHETETVEAKAATCTEVGWDAYEYCTECDYTTYAENPVVDHSDADNDGICDAGGEQLICPDCGRPLHDDSFVKNLICLIMSFINLIKAMF